jgi:16S rRNA (guanine527-N7)-methyltransferase
METLKIETQKLIGVTLNNHQLSLLDRFQKELEEWNTRFNLTAIQEPEKVKVKHFLDSFSAYLMIKDTPQKKIIDIGTGAGFPGIPIKILLPDSEVTLVDSISKKTEFCQHVITALQLKGIQVIQDRVEHLARKEKFREEFDWAVARAVAKLSTLSEYMLPFVKIGGRMLAMKGDQGPQEAQSAHQAINLLGGELSKIQKITLPGVTEDRFLILIEKKASTPEKYPRRVGIPGKRPL